MDSFIASSEKLSDAAGKDSPDYDATKKASSA